MTATVAPPASPLRQALAAARANLIPGLVLQALALAVILAYYFLPSSRFIFNAVEACKNHMGLSFAILSTATFGGLIPFCVQRFRRPTPWSDLAFLLIFWGLKGLEVDTLYRLEAHFIGADNSFRTIALKVLTDQFLYVPFWNTPTCVLIFLWKDSHYRLSEARLQLRQTSLLHRTLAVNIANWAVWVPVVALIYLLATPLQLPVENIILCLWSLMFMFLTRRPDAPTTLANPCPTT